MTDEDVLLRHQERLQYLVRPRDDRRGFAVDIYEHDVWVSTVYEMEGGSRMTREQACRRVGKLRLRAQEVLLGNPSLAFPVAGGEETSAQRILPFMDPDDL